MNNDTVNLLKECNAGIKMGVNSIDSVLPYVKSKEMKRVLKNVVITLRSLIQNTFVIEVTIFIKSLFVTIFNSFL